MKIWIKPGKRLEIEMSYEGYTQYWCENGHYQAIDVYDDYFNDSQFSCPHCDGAEAFRNSVNLTNGSYEYDEDETQIRIDGFIEPELLDEGQVCTCDCGHIHMLGPAVYAVPEREE